MKKALITGITGQDGSYLSELLLSKGYHVWGIMRRSSSFNTGRINHLYEDPEVMNKRLFLHYGDLIDTSSLNRLLVDRAREIRVIRALQFEVLRRERNGLEPRSA